MSVPSRKRSPLTAPGAYPLTGLQRHITAPTFLQMQVDLFCVDALLAGQFIERIQQLQRLACGFFIAEYPKLVTAVANFHPQTLLDLAQMFVKLTAKIGQSAVVVGFQSDFVWRAVQRIKAPSGGACNAAIDDSAT